MTTTRVTDNRRASAGELHIGDDHGGTPWRAPERDPYLRLATVGAEVLDGHELRLHYWPAGVAFVLDHDGPHRTVLGLAAARDLAGAILGHLDELGDPCDHLPPPPSRRVERDEDDDDDEDR